jgi:hypothetical protein
MAWIFIRRNTMKEWRKLFPQDAYLGPGIEKWI